MKNLPKIVIDVIPHKKHRYPTAGDYFKKNGELHIRVSKMGANHEFLVALHEIIEWYLTAQRNITIESIDKFDIEFENKRVEGNVDEPGDSKNAPYYKEHQFATKIETLMAEELGVNWNKYTDYVNSL